MKEYRECNFGSIRTYAEVMGGFLDSHKDYYENPHRYNIEPFKIFGNLYYVGDKKVCMHLIETTDGLILFDSGFSHNYSSLIQSIITLGFDPKDIKIIIHSHGHFDHFGGGDRLRSFYGSKIYMSKVDTDLIKENPARALMHLAPNSNDKICFPDVIIEDGDIIKLGNTQILCKLSPGHTQGTMSFFFDAADGDKVLKVGYFGGVGFLTFYKEYIEEYKLCEKPSDLLKNTVEQLKTFNVDITIGNHPNQVCLIEKREYMKNNPGANPFINKNTWTIFLEELENKRLNFDKLNY